MIMKKYSFTPRGICARQIDFELDDANKIHNLRFTGGCNGNLKAISSLVEGAEATHIAAVLRGNLCGTKGTSCADQFSHALEEAVAEAKK